MGKVRRRRGCGAAARVRRRGGGDAGRGVKRGVEESFDMMCLEGGCLGIYIGEGGLLGVGDKK